MIVEELKLTFSDEEEYNSILSLLDRLFPSYDVQANMVKGREGAIYWEIIIKEVMTANETIDFLNKA